MSERSGVLFDVDGTLVDTTFLHAVCWAEAMRQNGHTVPTAVVHHAIGMGGDELLDHCLGADRDHGDDDAIHAARLTLYRQYWGRLTLLPGARELLAECARRGLDVVLASSASEDELAALTDVLDSDDVITIATSAGDADAGKPDPDILQAALDRSGLSPQRCVFVGDAVWDGAAAAKVDVPFVALTCGGTPEQPLRDAGAVEVYDDPAGLLAALDDSAVARLTAARPFRRGCVRPRTGGRA